MTTNKKLETDIEKALMKISAAQQMIYSHPEDAANMLNGADEDLHKAIDGLLPRSVGATG